MSRYGRKEEMLKHLIFRNAGSTRLAMMLRVAILPILIFLCEKPHRKACGQFCVVSRNLLACLKYDVLDQMFAFSSKKKHKTL